MRSSVALLVAVLLAVSSVAGVGVSAAGVGETSTPDGRIPSPSSHSVSTYSGTSLLETAHSENSTLPNGTTPDTGMYVSLRKDGSARWTVTARFGLDDDNETAAFRDLAKSYERGNADAGFSAKTFERAVESAASDVDRPMAIRNVSRSARLLENGSVGVLSLSFTWTNFTRVEGSRIVLGDVFTTSSGTWLPALTDGQSLTIEAPDGYLVLSSNVPVDNGKLHYEGPRTFEPGRISVTYERRATTTTTTTATTTTSKGDFPDFSGSGVVLVLFLLSLGAGAYAWSQREDTDRVDDGDARVEDVDDGPSRAPSTADDATDEADADDGEEGEEEVDGPDPELLSDEERVLRLLRNNDGRMKQAQIVTETNWSNAKVSQLLSKMAENDDVNKLRIGRENLITLPGEDVTDTGRE